jgi:hypothetical protein
MIRDEANGFEKMADAGRGPYRTFVEAAVAIQKQNARFALGMFGYPVGMLAAGQAEATRALLEHSRAQQEALNALAERSLKAYVPHGRAPEGVASRDGSAPELPVEDYDRLDVEGLERRLEGLCVRDVERLKAHERRTRNRRTMMERMDRALV